MSFDQLESSFGASLDHIVAGRSALLNLTRAYGGERGLFSQRPRRALAEERDGESGQEQPPLTAAVGE